MREFLTRFPFELSNDLKNDICFNEYLPNDIFSVTVGGYKKPFYNCIFNTGYQLEGWKIHVSPYLKDYGKVLNIVTTLMLARKISFKFAYNLSDYLLLSDKNISPSQFGKYITIYPKNDNEFKSILKTLNEKLTNFDGVRVPSDRRYMNSKILSYRFGGFFPQIYMTNDGDMTYKILDGNGLFVSDERKTYFSLPKGISDPFSSYSQSLTTMGDPYLVGETTKRKFEIINIIRRLGTGNIYEGIDKNTKKRVIVKEARLGALPTRENCVWRAWDLKKNELKVLKNKELQELLNLPKYIDYLYIDDSFYIVEEELKGTSLRGLLQNNSLLAHVQSMEDKLDSDKNLLIIWRQILDMITALHTHGYVLNDISDDNFIYDEETKKVSLIDVETIQLQKENKYSKITTNNFCLRMPSTLDDYNKDCYKLSLLMFYTVFNKVNDFMFDDDFFIKRFNLLKNKLTEFQKKIVGAAFNIHYLSKVNKLKKSTNLSIFLDNSDLIDYSKDLKDISKQDISDLKSTIMAQYINNFSQLSDFLKCTPYVNEVSDCSLMYGKLGTILLLKKELPDKNFSLLINKVKNKIIEAESKKQLNLGLFFGLAGTTLFEFYTNTSFEKNYSLIKLLERLQYEPQNNSLCNGYVGIAWLLQQISRKKGYPDFTAQINTILSNLEKDIGKTTDEGLEYGDLGAAIVFLEQYKATKEKHYLNSVKVIIKNYVERYKNDKSFTGISYNIKKWKNIRSPYLMNGSAGLIYVLSKYYQIVGKVDWNLMEKYIDSLNLPFTYNYGVNNGTAGILLTIDNILYNLKPIPNPVYKKLKKLKSYYIKHIYYSYVNSKQHMGWPSDGQTFISDDLGAGTLGILYVLISSINGRKTNDDIFL